MDAEVYTPQRSETSFEQIDRKMAECRQIAERREQLLRLLHNADFKALILKFYLVDEAARLAQMSGHLGLKPEDSQGFMAMAQATGHLKRFFDVVDRQGEQALNELRQYIDNYDELTSYVEEPEGEEIS